MVLSYAGQHGHSHELRRYAAACVRKKKAVRAFKSLTHFGARQIYGIG